MICSIKEEKFFSNCLCVGYPISAFVTLACISGPKTAGVKKKSENESQGMDEVNM